jgi:hypothetical protein
MELGGTNSRCTVDNSSVVVAHGTGKQAVIAAEMVSFSKRFGFNFVAHEKGDANRSAGVERLFYTIERNFYPGRTFSSLKELNQKLRQWCDDRNHLHRRHLNAKPIDLFEQQKHVLKPLPIHVPEVYQLHHRLVDVCGYVQVNTNRYSVPADMIGREVEVRESIDQVRIFRGHQLICTHDRQEAGAKMRVTLPEHAETKRFQHCTRKPPPLPEEETLRKGPAELGEMIDLLRRVRGEHVVRPVRSLHRLYCDYPESALVAALRTALNYKLTDMNRIENMVLKAIGTDFFRLPHHDEHQEG